MAHMISKFLTLAGMLVLLSGCSSFGAPDVSEPKYTAYLEMKSQQQIKRILGEPVIVRMEAPHQVWAYRTGDCSTLVYFNETGTSQYVDVRGNCQRAVAGAF